MAGKAGPPATYPEAWAPEPPSGDAWTARPWVHPSVRLEQGRLARKRVPRTSHAAFEPPRGVTRSPSSSARRPTGCPTSSRCAMRAWRSRPSPTTAAHPRCMAFDLATTPRTDIIVQASGDAHLSNFGLFASPGAAPRLRCQRLRRDAAGPLGVGRQAARREHRHRRARQRLQRRPRTGRPRWPPCAPTASGWPRFAAMRLIDVWYSYITDDAIRAAAEPFLAGSKDGAARRAKLEGLFSKARGQRRAPRRELADHDRRWPARRRRRPAGHPARRDPRRARCHAQGLRGLPRHDGREPPRVPGALPLRRLRAQGRGRRQRRDALLRPHPRGPRRGRPAHPAGQGGDRLGARGARRRQPAMPTTASASWSASA